MAATRSAEGDAERVAATRLAEPGSAEVAPSGWQPPTRRSQNQQIAVVWFILSQKGYPGRPLWAQIGHLRCSWSSQGAPPQPSWKVAPLRFDRFPIFVHRFWWILKIFENVYFGTKYDNVIISAKTKDLLKHRFFEGFRRSRAHWHVARQKSISKVGSRAHYHQIFLSYGSLKASVRNNAVVGLVGFSGLARLQTQGMTGHLPDRPPPGVITIEPPNKKSFSNDWRFAGHCLKVCGTCLKVRGALSTRFQKSLRINEQSSSRPLNKDRCVFFTQRESHDIEMRMKC